MLAQAVSVVRIERANHSLKCSLRVYYLLRFGDDDVLFGLKPSYLCRVLGCRYYCNIPLDVLHVSIMELG